MNSGRQSDSKISVAASDKGIAWQRQISGRTMTPARQFCQSAAEVREADIFKRIFSRAATRRQAQDLYQAILRHSRDPVFFIDGGIPDSLDGRFEILALNLALVMRRLKQDGAAGRGLGRYLLEAMIADIDSALREVGASDPSMGRKMKQVAHGFHGRLLAYDQALSAEDSQALGAALRRNLFGVADHPESPIDGKIALFVHYTQRTAEDLARQPFKDLQSGIIHLPAFTETERAL